MAQHKQLFAEVCEMLWTDPDDLLPRHQYLLEGDFHDLGAGRAAGRQVWLALTKLAIAAVNHVRAGRPVAGSLGSFPQHTQVVNGVCPSREGIMVCRRCRSLAQ